MDLPVPPANMPSHGRKCGKPDCDRSAELAVSWLPDNVTWRLQPQMLCTVSDHRGGDVSPSWLHHG